MSNQHRWKFSRIGGFDQALITSTEDLLNFRAVGSKALGRAQLPGEGLAVGRGHARGHRHRRRWPRAGT